MRNFNYDKGLNVFLFLFSFSIIAVPKLIALLCLFFLIFQLYFYFQKQIFLKFELVLVLLMAFYFAYLIGCIFTLNSGEALRYLENKLSFLVFPILFLFKKNQIRDIKFAGVGLISGVFIMSIIYFYKAINIYLFTNNYEDLLSSSFSYSHHPTYFSIFLLISIFIVFKAYKEKWKFFNFWICFILISFFLVSQLFCFSLAGLMLLLLVTIISMIYKLFLMGGIYRILILIFPFFLYFSLTKLPIISDQFNVSKLYFDKFIKNPQKFVEESDSHAGGNITRLVMWYSTCQEIKQHPFGVGTGNVDIYLDQRLEKNNQGEMIRYHYNPHNQMLQTTLEIGVIGLLIFIALISYLLFISFKYKNGLLLIITGSLLFNSFFESILQRQSGIVFFSFWICLLSTSIFKPITFKEPISIN